MLVLMLVLVLTLIAMQASPRDANAAKKKAAAAKKVAATCMPEAWLSCACIAELCMHTCTHARCIHDNCFVHAQSGTDAESSSDDDEKEKKKKVCLDTHAQMHFVCITVGILHAGLAK